MSEKYAEIVIAGMDLTGLIAGAFLAKRGLSVCVLNFDDAQLERSKSIQSNLVSHLESRLFKNIMGRLGIMDNELGIVETLHTPYQVVMPKRRINVSIDRDLFEKELEREFPEDFSAIKEFYHSLDLFDSVLDTEQLQDLILPHSWWQKFNFKRFVKQNKLSEQLSSYLTELENNQAIKSFLDAQINFLCPSMSHDPYTYVISRLLSNDNSILYDIRGGLDRLKRIFINKIENYGGVLRHGVSIKSFDGHKRLIEGLKLEGLDTEIDCKYVIWNHDLHSLSKLIPKNMRTLGFFRKLDTITPRYFKFSLQLKIKPEHLPLGMQKNVLYIVDENKELLGANSFHINVMIPDPADPTYNEADQFKYLVVTYSLPADKLYSPKEFFIEIHQQIIAQIKTLMPFADSLELDFPRHEDKGKLMTDARQNLMLDFDQDDFEAFRLKAQQHAIFEYSTESFEDLCPLSNKVYYKNLYLSSPELMASFGFEGKFLLALKTIDQIWAEVESRRKNLRQRRIA